MRGNKKPNIEQSAEIMSHSQWGTVLTKAQTHAHTMYLPLNAHA